MGRKERQAKGYAKAKERAAKANEAGTALIKKGEQAGHGIKLTRAEIKAAKEQGKNG